MNSGDTEVHYNVSKEQFSMLPDYRQTLPGGKTYVVEFDRGGGHGKARYSVKDGAYAFTPTDRGWELYRQS